MLHELNMLFIEAFEATTDGEMELVTATGTTGSDCREGSGLHEVGVWPLSKACDKISEQFFS